MPVDEQRAFTTCNSFSKLFSTRQVSKRSRMRLLSTLLLALVLSDDTSLTAASDNKKASLRSRPDTDNEERLHGEHMFYVSKLKKATKQPEYLAKLRERWARYELEPRHVKKGIKPYDDQYGHLVKGYKGPEQPKTEWKLTKEMVENVANDSPNAAEAYRFMKRNDAHPYGVYERIKGEIGHDKAEKIANGYVAWLQKHYPGTT